ncbi:Uma2 family endonuclease [Sorangium sp. So ce1335]|uniref:Uma2 family endonuclease n=1 Tax=Sorangium sp. So ce1335 TaxID=3133335 RepID=UPI003F62DEF6
MGNAAIRQAAMTFEAAARLDPDDAPGELDAGRWVPVTKNTWRHGEVASNVCLLLRLYARQHPGWSVAVGDPGTKLGHDPDILRGPDVAMVRSDRRPQGRGADGWLEGAPDVAVEIVGDSQSASELAKKALEYLAAGAKLVWVLDPEPGRLMIFTPPNQIRVLGRGDALDGGDALPGFSCRVDELFE